MDIKVLYSQQIDMIENIQSQYDKLYYIGNLDLLKKRKISIVGSRHPNSYSKQMISKLASRLSEVGICIVSGGAMGIDAIAHKAAKYNNTIMVAGTGLDKQYPAINKNMINQIENNGLILSQFTQGTPSLPRNFAIRNKLIVMLSDILIVGYADLNSGSIRSVEYAKKTDKKIYVLPHRIGESQGTNQLLKDGVAQTIYDIDEFVEQFGDLKSNDTQDQFLQYCSTNPTYDEAVLKYSSKVFEYELCGKIIVQNGFIYLA